MITVLVLEDVKNTREAIEAMIREVSEEINVVLADTKEEAVRHLFEVPKIDLFLLDVNLNMKDDEDKSGFDFAKKIREFRKYELTPIVFLTSVSNLEIQSYRETQCYKYITKPFRKTEIADIVKKVLFSSRASETKHITVKKDGINYRLNTAEIISIKAVPRGISIYLTGEELEIKYVTIKQIMEQLDGAEFIQCHRTWVINSDYIENIDLVNRMVKLKGQEELVEIGVTYKEKMKAIM